MGQSAAICAPPRDRTSVVKVHIYDFSAAPAAELAGSTSYQVTLEVRGKEYSYRSKDGIFSRPSGEHPELECKEAVHLGRAEPTSELEAAIKDLSVPYTASQFNTLTRNSGHFCNDLCLRLGVDPAPVLFMRLASQGASADEHVAKVATEVRSAAAAMAAKASELEVVNQVRDAAAARVQNIKAKAEELDATARSGISTKKADLSARAQALDAKLGVSATTAGLAAKAQDLATQAADARDSISKTKARGAKGSEGYQFGDLTRGLMKAAWSAPGSRKP